MRGSIRKQSADSWRITISLGKNPSTDKYEKYQETFQGRKPEADARLAELLVQLEKGISINPKKITFSDFLDKWMDDCRLRNLSQRTLDGYQSIIDNHLKPELGKHILSKLHPSYLREFYGNLLKEGRKDNKKSVGKALSPTTVLHIHRVIHEALEAALEWELVARNVAHIVKPPKPETKETPFMLQDDIGILVPALKETTLYVPAYIALSMGTRLSETLAIRWQDVDLKRGVIAIRQSCGVRRKAALKDVPADKLPKKGRNEVYFKPTKSKKPRTIDIPVVLVEVLKKHQTEQKKNKLAFGPLYQDQGLVCCREDGTPYNPYSFSGAFSKVARAAGCFITFHGLRHSHATWLCQEGEHPKTVSERLGHSKIGITMDLYTHAIPGAQKRAARKIDEILAGQQ